MPTFTLHMFCRKNKAVHNVAIRNMSFVSKFLIEPFSPLKDRNFSIYITGQTVSQIGTFMQTTAQAWLIWELTHDARMVSLATALGFLPLFFLSPFTGALADRWDRRKLLIGTQIAAMTLALTLAFLVQRGLADVTIVLFLSLAVGVVNTFDFPTQSAFIGDMTGMGAIRKAVALNTSMFQVGRSVGPALAGILIALFGSAFVFLLNGLSYIVVIAGLLVSTTTQVRRPHSGTPLNDFAEAVRYARTESRIVDLIMAAILLTLFVFGTFSIFAPLADTVLNGGPETLGLIQSASGLGALVSALLLAPQFANVKRVGVVICGALIFAGFWLMMTLFSTWTPYVQFTIFMASLTLPVVLAGTSGLIQTLSPPHMRARMISLFQMTTFGAQPLGALFAGFMGSLIGPLYAIVLNGGLMAILATLLISLRHDFRVWVVTKPEIPK